MGMRISQTWIESDAGRREAIVMTPDAHQRVGRDRLEALRQAPEVSDLDREILAKVRALPRADRVAVFRGKPRDAGGSWGFADDLSEDERTELGYLLVRAELPTYRRLVAAGVFAIVHVEWGADEAPAYQQGTTRLLKELEAKSIGEVEGDPEDVAVSTADRFILRHLNHFFDDGYDQVVRSMLLAHLATFEARIPHFRAMIDKLPASAIA